MRGVKLRVGTVQRITLGVNGQRYNGTLENGMKQGQTGTTGQTRRIVTPEDKAVIIDEHFAYSVGSMCADDHPEVFMMIAEWTNHQVGVYMPPCWVNDILSLIIAAEKDESPNKSCSVDLLDVFHSTRVRPFGFPQDVLLRVLAIANFLDKYESTFNLRDAQYLAMAEALETNVYTTDPAFKERMDTISRLAVFEEHFGQFEMSEDPTLSRLGDRLGNSFTKVDVTKLATRVRLAK